MVVLQVFERLEAFGRLWALLLLGSVRIVSAVQVLRGLLDTASLYVGDELQYITTFTVRKTKK